MSLDTLKESFVKVVKALTPVDYFAYYPAKVVKQNSDDLTLDLQPDDARIPGMERVPIRFGTPQTTAKVLAGARVLVGFAEGNPKLPICTVWESATITELNFGGGSDFVALATLVKGELQALRTAIAGHITLYNTHTHPVSGPNTLVTTMTGTAPDAINDVAAATMKAR